MLRFTTFTNKKIILKPFVIGIGLSESYKKNFECVGTFYDAKNPEQFKEILNVVVSQVLNSTSAQVNLLDQNEMPTESNVAISFYDAFSGILQYNFIHTMNSKGNPDTLVLDPVLSYNVVAHTLPVAKAKGSWKLNPGKHTTIPIYAPQGDLSILSKNTKINTNCIVREHKQNQTLNIQEINTKQRYITGTYDLEILTLPRIYQTVEIKQSELTKVQIPESGLVVVSFSSSGYGSLFKMGNELEWLCDLKPTKANKVFISYQENIKSFIELKTPCRAHLQKKRSFV